jgi:hypothetical protein
MRDLLLPVYQPDSHKEDQTLSQLSYSSMKKGGMLMHDKE